MNTVPVTLDPDERKVYDRFRNDMVAEIRGEEIDAANAAVLAGKLLQTAGGAIYGEDDTVLPIHEGVAARAMEKNGIISDRCEINRQIKADNALLRELKELVKNLSDIVDDAAASIGDKLAQLRENMIVLCYQLKRIALGKDKMTRKRNAVQPLLKQYNEIVRQIKQKTKARKALLAEQKNTSKLNLIKQHDLSKQITTLTEEIEELHSERENLLLNLDCLDDAGVKVVQSEITAMEASLRRLDEQEEKYSSELEDAIQQYKSIRQHVEQVDLNERNDRAYAAAANRLQKTYGNHFNAKLLQESRHEVMRLLKEDDTPRSVREQLRHPHGEQTKEQHARRIIHDAR